MVYDSINASIPTAASKDFGKKKRVNRTAKLKQSKLDVRREQWLSQVKNRGLGFKEEARVTGGVKLGAVETHAVDEKDLPLVKLEVSVAAEETHYTDSESPSNSPTNFTGSSSSRSSTSSGSRGGGCFSRSVTDEDDVGHDDNDNNNNNNGNDNDNNDDDDDCLDDWETMADALAADDILKNDNNNPNLESPVHEPAPESVEPDLVLTKRMGQEAHRAWRPDDASRPQNLPNLLKQNSFPIHSGSQHGVRFANMTPSSCPICCEDLDMTDSSFLPCPCGYRLCLFCHKRILEENGRCPGCRKQYDQVDRIEQVDHKAAPLKLARCYSANPRH